MEKILVKGDVYTVATKTECKVTSANGTPLGTATAEAPYTFTATTDRVVLSDPDAEFARVNPKYAPAKLRLLGLLGGGVSASALPAGYLEAEFVDIYTAVPGIPVLEVSPDTPDFEIEAVVRMREDSFKGYNFLTNDNVQFAIMLYTSYNTLVRWQYGGNYSHAGQLTQGKIQTLLKKGRYNYIDGTLVSTHPADAVISQVSTNYLCASTYLTKVALYSYKANDGIGSNRHFVPALSADGKPGLYEIETKTFYERQWSIGMNMKQALKLSKLPAGGGTLTVSLPWDAQFADTGVPDALQTAADTGWTLTVQYREEGAERISRYAACTTAEEIKAVNPDYMNDITADGGWVYPLPKLVNAHLGWVWSKFKYVACDAPNVTNMHSAFAHSTVDSFEGDWSNVTNADYAFCRDWIYSQNPFDIKTSFPNLSTGKVMFNYRLLNKQSALNVLNSIPAWENGTHQLTIGIHVDHQADEEVLTAIENAQAKGWSLSLQWNGTATAQTASTLGLRRPPIYAKLGTLELPDGTTEQFLDWGHYVTDWEANGYQEFSSVEEAKEYFNVGD